MKKQRPISRAQHNQDKYNCKELPIDSIPVTWKIRKLHSVTRKIIDGAHFTPEYVKHGVPFLRVTDIRNSKLNFGNLKYISKQEHGTLTKRCKPEKDDILYSKNGTVGVAKLVTWSWEFSIFVSLALIKVKKEVIIPRFLKIVLGSGFIKRQILLRSKQGTVVNLHLEEIREFDVPVPPKPEQAKIAEILSTVDRAIEQTEALIAKQQRIKTGLMQDLLTRGIDDQGNLRSEQTHPFKDSPLGRIPVEWEVDTVESMCELIVDCPHTTPVYTKGGIPCIRTADIQPGFLLTDKALCVDKDTYLDRVLRAIPKKHDIIYSREGERLGIAAPVGEERVCLGQRVMLLRPHFESSSYLLWSMNSKDFYHRAVSGLGITTTPHINVADIRRLKIRKPLLDEQVRIGNMLKTKQSTIQDLKNMRTKLLNLKTALMQDLLTGKKRVTSFLKDETIQPTRTSP